MAHLKKAWSLRRFVSRVLAFLALIFLASEVRHTYQVSPENVALAVLQVGPTSCYDGTDCYDANGIIAPTGPGTTNMYCPYPPCDPIGNPPCGTPDCVDDIPVLPFSIEALLKPAPEEHCDPDPKKTDSDPVNLFSGEFTLSATDMVIPGRGFDFVLKRNYRSRTSSLVLSGNANALAPGAIMGFNWDMSYNIFLVNGTNSLIFHDGTGRSDTFTLIAGSTNTYGRDEYFRTITKNSDDSFTMLHADGTRWEFAPMNNMGTTSKITAMIDRNGNTMRFVYQNVVDAAGNSAQGLLTTIYDTLDHTTSSGTIGPWIQPSPAGPSGSSGPEPLILSQPLALLRRAIDFDYTNGLLTSVTDWIGRTVTYQYDGNKDMISVTTPAVIGTPGHANDFPSGKTTSYTYSQGISNDVDFCLGYVWHCELVTAVGNCIPPLGIIYQASDNPPTWWCCGWLCGSWVTKDMSYGFLNHNLLTITDAKGKLILQNNYALTLSPTNPTFDHIVSQEYGDDTYSFTYSPASSPDSEGIVRRTIVNNRMGQVRELFYDDRNRLVKRWEFTGFADPALPTTGDIGLGLNLPVGRLRGTDPTLFETKYAYDKNSRKTKITHPNGNFEEFCYDSTNSDRRFQGNLTKHRWSAGPGTYTAPSDQTMIEETFTYETDLGSGGACCGGFNFVKTHTDGRGNFTTNDFSADGKGNLIQTTHRDLGVENWTYNEYGQVQTHTLPDNGSGHRRVDLYTYYPSSDQQFGYLHKRIVDNGGLSLTTTYVYDFVGNVTRKTDPRGNDTIYTVNELNQVVREESRLVNGVRYRRNTFYDLNDNVVQVGTDNRDESGNFVTGNPTLTTTYDYDILNFMIRKTEEVDASRSIVTEYVYNNNKKLIHIDYGEATNGNQPLNTVDREYDERDLLFKEIRAKLDADKSTTQYDYDGNKNLTLITQGTEDGNLHKTTNAYDGYDRLVTTTDALSNITTYHYDRNHNRVSSKTTGQGGAGSRGLSQTLYTYDAMDRMTQADVDFFNAFGGDISDAVSTTKVTYSQNSQILSVTDDGGDITGVTYDTANRRSVITDAAGNTISYAYDLNSNVTQVVEVDKSQVDGSTETFTTAYDYDNLDRLLTTTDNVGNVMRYDYDSRNNRTLMTDALGNKTRYVYDGLNRLVKTVRDMDDGVANIAAVPGDGDADIVTVQTWDDSSRMTSRTDDNGNVTVYEYDPLDRMKTEVFADCTQTGYVYDVHDNPTTITDPNGSVITCTYDLLDRLIRRDIAPGPGVADGSNGGVMVEKFGYDGLSRLVTAMDDIDNSNPNDPVDRSSVSFQYDSLSNVISDDQFLTGFDWGTTTATFDGDSNMLTCKYPGGRTIGYTYDELDRKQTITDDTGVAAGQSGLLIASYKYIGRNRVAWRDYGNNTRMDYVYDGLANLPGDFGVRQVVGTTHSGSGGVIDDRSYTWDRMFNKTRREDTRAGGPRLRHDYTYDPAYRLTHTVASFEFEPASFVTVRDTAYNLDGVHNRLSTSGTVNGNPDPAAGNYVMNPAACTDLAMNQYTATPVDQRNYDANGNLTGVVGTNAAISCLYDYRNRMVEYYDSATGQRNTYTYDALGRRIAKTVNVGGVNGTPTTTRYLYGGESQWQVCEERAPDSVTPSIFRTSATYVYGRYIDEVLQMQRCPTGQFCGFGGTPPVDYYYHTDDMYNVMAVTDSTGNVVERYEYDDYGTPMFMDAAGNALTQSDGTPLTSSAIANPYLFTGRRYDPESGWYNYRTRYIDPKSGKFTTRDVIGIWGDPWEFGNGYSYVANGPGTWLDPFGLLSDLRDCSEQDEKEDDEYKPDKCRAAAQLALKNCLRSYKKGGPGAPTKENCFKTFTQHQAACRAGKPGQHNEEVMAGSDYLDCVGRCLDAHNAAEKGIGIAIGVGVGIKRGQGVTSGRGGLRGAAAGGTDARRISKLGGKIAERIGGRIGGTITRGAKMLGRGGARAVGGGAVIAGGAVAGYYDVKCLRACKGNNNAY